MSHHSPVDIEEVNLIAMLNTLPTVASIPAHASDHCGPQTIQEKPYTIRYVSMIEDLPSFGEILSWNGKFDSRDPLDERLRSLLVQTDEGHFTTYPASSIRFLPPNNRLERFPAASMPDPLKHVVCYYPPLDLQPESVAVGARIPAGPLTDRAVIVSHVCQQGLNHFLLCAHGLCDIFLLRIHDDWVVKEWPLQGEVEQKYAGTMLETLFRGEIDTNFPGLVALATYFRIKRIAEDEAIMREYEFADPNRDLPWFAQWGQEHF